MSVGNIAQVPGVHPIVQLGVGGLYDPAGDSQWQVDTWGGTGRWSSRTPSWVDITCYTHEVQTFSGRDRASDTWEVGTATITVDNATGWADYPETVDIMDIFPEQLGGHDPSAPPHDPDPELEIMPGREVRVGVQIDYVHDEPIWLWRGIIDATTPTYSPTEGDKVTFQCIDAKGDAGRVELKPVDPPVGAGEQAHARITRILNAGKHPSWRRLLSPTGVQLLATPLGGRVIEQLDHVADSSGGAVYGDPEGRVVYRSRDWQVTVGDPVYDATIGNMGQTGSGIIHDPIPDPLVPGLYTMDPSINFVEDTTPGQEGLAQLVEPNVNLVADPVFGLFLVIEADLLVCPSGWEVSFGRADFPNRIIVGNSAEEQPDLIYEDAKSQKLFGVETYDRSGLNTQNKVDLQHIGQRLLTTRSWELAPRIQAVTLDAATEPACPLLLAAASPFKPSRYACHHRAGDRTIFSRAMMLVGINHTITPTSWTARLALDDASPYDRFTAGRWQTTGRWKSTEWTTL